VAVIASSMIVHSALGKTPSAAKRPWRLRGVPTPQSVRIQKAEIESAGMNKQSFEHVLVPAHVRSPEPARLVEMRTGSLEQFAASAEEPLAAVAADAPSIRILKSCTKWMKHEAACRSKMTPV
jgi:hypothetical protein